MDAVAAAVQRLHDVAPRALGTEYATPDQLDGVTLADRARRGRK